MKSVKLPNGMIVAGNQGEALWVYHEIFVEEIYTQHSISIKDGDCVFDVGANIGLFSLSVLARNQRLRVFCFEPIPEIFTLLEQNVSPRAGASMVTLCNFGLSERGGEAVFSFDPHSTVLSTMRGDSVERAICRDVPSVTWAAAGVANLERMGALSHRSAHVMQAALKLPVSRQVLTGLLLVWERISNLRRQGRSRQVRCRLRTLSQMIEEHNLNAIDLLKIDVEGSELDILRGLDDRDWGKVRQIVAEVHDVDGGIETMQSMLVSKGYRTVVTRDCWDHSPLMGVYMVYALRQ